MKLKFCYNFFSTVIRIWISPLAKSILGKKSILHQSPCFLWQDGHGDDWISRTGFDLGAKKGSEISRAESCRSAEISNRTGDSSRTESCRTAEISRVETVLSIGESAWQKPEVDHALPSLLPFCFSVRPHSCTIYPHPLRSQISFYGTWCL